MWLLHIVVVHGGSGWPAAALFGLSACLSGWLLAALAGETHDETALTLDLTLAGVGALIGQAAANAAGTDPLATVFGVRLFACAFGALLLLSLDHDLCAVERLPRRVRPLRCRGGLLCTFLGLDSWPETVTPNAIDAGGLRLALLPPAAHDAAASLEKPRQSDGEPDAHSTARPEQPRQGVCRQTSDATPLSPAPAIVYEERIGPLRGTRTFSPPRDATLALREDGLTIASPDAAAPLLRRDGLVWLNGPAAAETSATLPSSQRG